jgi:hypothetical protein
MENTDNRLSAWSYIIQTQISGWQQYFYWTWPFTAFDVTQWLSTNNLQYSLCQTSTGWQACPWNLPTSVEGKFFRSVRGIWLFTKFSSTDGWDTIVCTKSTDSFAGGICKDDSAKEYRFCVTVDYVWNIVGKVELCSILTNFKK